MIGNTSGSRGLLSQNTSVHQNMIFSTNVTLCCLDHKPGVDRSNQESKRELLDPTSEYSKAIWDQQGRPVKGIIVPKSGHSTAYVERFVCVLCIDWAHLPYVLGKKKKKKTKQKKKTKKKNNSSWCISLSV